MDREGAIASNAKNIWHIEPPRVKIENDVGCGDAMLGGFLYALGNAEDFKEAAIMAVAMGTANGMNLKPGFIKHQELKRVRARIKIRNIG